MYASFVTTLSGGKVLHELRLFLWIGDSFQEMRVGDHWVPYKEYITGFLALHPHCLPPHVQKRNLSNYFETRIFVKETGQFGYMIILKFFKVKVFTDSLKKRN